MTTIVTRAGKGSPLTNVEVDANFTNLNNDKIEKTGGTITANSSSAALTITQAGSGDALRVEDASGDTTPFVIDGVGDVGIGVTPIANTTSRLFLSKDISFTGSNKTLMGNLYFDGDWKSFGNGTGGYIKLAGSSTSAIEIGYAGNNSSGTGAVANAAPAIILNNVGGVGIGGGEAGAGNTVSVMKGMTGATVSIGISNSGNVRSDVTSQARYFQSFANTQATTFTLGQMLHYIAEQGTFGAGSTVINQYGFYASSALTGATTNYGFYGNIPAGAGRWNFYAAGTADNVFNGNVKVINGSAALGYGTGAGGTVTQATSKSTSVTLNKPTGQITMNGAALAAGASVVFVVNNSLTTLNDLILINLSSGVTDSFNYKVETISGGADTFRVKVTNLSAVSLSEALVLNFAVLKGATA